MTLIVTAEPLDHDKHDGTKHNAVYQSLQCDPVSAALNIIKHCYTIMVEHRIQKCHDQKPRQGQQADSALSVLRQPFSSAA